MASTQLAELLTPEEIEQTVRWRNLAWMLAEEPELRPRLVAVYAAGELVWAARYDIAPRGGR